MSDYDNAQCRLASRGASAQADSLQLAFPALIPERPYCCDDPGFGLQVRGRHAALKRRHIQFNGPSAFRWMVHDLDFPGAHRAHQDARLPPPNVIAVNPDNGHAHVAYLMATPIARHSMARLGPLKFFAAVERGIARRLDADRCYSGLIAKNPVHSHWRTEWPRELAYDLRELAGFLFPHNMRPDACPVVTFGAGRNVTVFDELRFFAYREVREFKRTGAAYVDWLARCENVALQLNLRFPEAMKLSEVRAIAKSVARWTWRRLSVEGFSARQSALGTRAMAARWGGHTADSTSKPWVALGISRRTYYRRKKRCNLLSGTEVAL